MYHASLPMVKIALSKSCISFTSNNDNNLLCSACETSKSHKQPYLARNSYTFVPFQVVHSDVLVAPIISKNGFRYYVHFVDEYNLFT